MSWRKPWILACVVLVVGLGLAAAAMLDPQLRPTRDPDGAFETVSSTGAIDSHNPFFLPQGSNGRSCASCHPHATGWALSPAEVQQRFLRTAGTDPVFRPVDGATCPSDDTSTVWARMRAYHLLLTKGLIRIQLDVPANADFQVLKVETPYACNDTQQVSVYRRPLPATNLRFLTTVMWDGRESPSGRSLTDSLRSQAFDAIMGHQQAATPPSPQTVDQIVQFESSLYSAQVRDVRAGWLNRHGAQGGPDLLLTQPFFPGINNLNSQGQPQSQDVFQLYGAWTHSDVPDRAAVARGEAIFNRRLIPITGVAGLNDALNQPVINGACSTCHNTPNVGDHSVPGPLNIGVADASRRTPDLPLLTLRCDNGDVVQTSDPGRALISGKCADIGKFKGPILRDLAVRAPYFHNGSAATLMDVVNFYDTRFNLGLTDQEKHDLVAFLRTL